jgi:hypothetical protein
MTVSSGEGEQILGQDTLGRVLTPRERRESVLEEYDRSGMSAAKFAGYIGIKYSTLAYWIQSRRERRRKEKALLVASSQGEPGRGNDGWIEAVVEGGAMRAEQGGLRIEFAGGAYCQIRSAREAALAAELLGRLGSRR